MQRMLSRLALGVQRTLLQTRRLFCAAEGPELLVYHSENDAISGMPPRSRHVVKGVRPVLTGPRTLELQVGMPAEHALACHSCALIFLSS